MIRVKQMNQGRTGSRMREEEKVGCINGPCLLYTSDAADERSSVDLGGRRIIKKKNTEENGGRQQRITITKDELREHVHDKYM